MDKNDIENLSKIKEEINNLLKVGFDNFIVSQNREYHRLLRQFLNSYEDAVSGGIHIRNSGAEEINQELKAFAKLAIRTLGGIAEPCLHSLKEYRSKIYGPYLGVSNEGSAVKNLIAAAYDSPKAELFENITPIQLGFAHDAEILAATGEVAVGPDEYARIKIESIGKILTSTNVGARVNVKYYKSWPIVTIKNTKDQNEYKNVINKIESYFKPFKNTLNNIPRAYKILISFEQGTPFDLRKEILVKLLNEVKSGRICDPDYHTLGLLAFVKGSTKGFISSKRNIELANETSINDLTIWGKVRKFSEDRISLPCLLNYFTENHSKQLLAYARERNVSIEVRNRIDTNTVARHIWSGLQVAKSMGLELGKYGLIPLTLEESDKVMGKIQRWLPDWTAAPVLYIDYSIVSKENVYFNNTIIAGIKLWLSKVSDHKIPVVLIDTVEKDRENRLLKANDEDSNGIFTEKELIEIQAFAEKKNIKVLWAGGITVNQVFIFGKMKSFGIYVTTAASENQEVSHTYVDEPMAYVKEPTYEGVSRVKLLLEAGFLFSKLGELRFGSLKNQIFNETLKFQEIINNTENQDNYKSGKLKLHKLLSEGWKVVRDNTNGFNIFF